MQQRRVRLGDILDDYCPRERRITNHVVAAMIDDTVKQTRCTTCDADHEYREARVPAVRRRRTGALAGDPDAVGRPRPAVPEPEADALPAIDEHEEAATLDAVADDPLEAASTEPATTDTAEADTDEAPPETDQDEWPVHRPLIRATLPRPEGQVPERKAPDFTFRPAGGRFDSRNGQRPRHRGARPAQGQPSGQGRFGGPRQGAGQGPRQGSGQGHGQGQRHGNRQGPAGGGRPGQGRGPRPGGSGRKRGR